MLHTSNPPIGRLIVLIAGLMASIGWANPVQRDHIEVELVSEVSAIAPGSQTRLGLRLLPEVGWHTYWENPGDSGLPIEMAWTLPPGSQISEIVWPYPKRIEIGHLVNYGFEGEHLLPVEVSWPEDLVVGTEVQITLDTRWLVCEVECIPGEASLSLTLPVESSLGKRVESTAHLFDWADARHPIDMPADAGYKIESGQLSIQIPQSGLPNSFASSAEHVFITATNVVDHAKPFFLSSGDDVIQLALPLSPYFNGRLDAFSVVLVDPSTGESHQWRATESDLVSTEMTGTDLPYAWVLVLALVGGVLLNLMPCVFPVLSIKALHLVQTPNDQHKTHAVSYTAGVLLSFAVLAGILLVLRAAGEAVGWGFQLQTPWVVGVLIYVLFALGLSLSGVFEIGGGIAGLGQSMTQSSGLKGSFMTGVLATVVASPCTAPMMGTALGVAVFLPWPMAMGVFLALGFGLALPLLILGFIPAFARALPKPGPWMETFKQAMAFPLYLAVVWLIWVLARQTDPMAVAYILAGLVILACVLWLSRLPERHPSLSGIRHTLIALGLIACLAALAAASRSEPTEVVADGLSEPFSMERLEAVRADPTQGVFVNMTADWCVTCLVNERIALSGDEFANTLSEHNIVYLKGDWTRRDPAITAYLEMFGRNGVPLYVVYPKDGSEPRVLPQVLTPNGVISALEGL